MAERGERASGTPNTIYDLSSVLFHTHGGQHVLRSVLRDVEEAGDYELVEVLLKDATIL